MAGGVLSLLAFTFLFGILKEIKFSLAEAICYRFFCVYMPLLTMRLCLYERERDYMCRD